MHSETLVRDETVDNVTHVASAHIRGSEVRVEVPFQSREPRGLHADTARTGEIPRVGGHHPCGCGIGIKCTTRVQIRLRRWLLPADIPTGQMSGDQVCNTSALKQTLDVRRVTNAQSHHVDAG